MRYRSVSEVVGSLRWYFVGTSLALDSLSSRSFLITLLLFQIVPCANEHRSKLCQYNVNFMICIKFHESDLWYEVTD